MRMLDEHVGIVMDLFRDLFECDGRLFGSPVAGISDGVEGVQWNAGYDGTAWLGVNLEGMQYDRWPIARLIKREISDPLLLSKYRDGVPRPDMVTVSWRRDAWQVRSRPLIRNSHIAPTPINLDQLKDDGWAQALLQARECLDPKRGHRGRRKIEVTLASSGRVAEMEVTPHLYFRTRFDKSAPQSMRRAKDNLEALHQFARDQAGRQL